MRDPLPPWVKPLSGMGEVVTSAKTSGFGVEGWRQTCFFRVPR